MQQDNRAQEAVDSFFRKKRDVDFASLRVVRSTTENLGIRHGVPSPVGTRDEIGAMVTVHCGGSQAYASTSDLSERGLEAAYNRAFEVARKLEGLSIVNYSNIDMPASRGSYESQVGSDWRRIPLEQKLSELASAAEILKSTSGIIDSEVALSQTFEEHLYATSSEDIVEQRFSTLYPVMYAVAEHEGEIQMRSLAGHNVCRQAGYELIDTLALNSAAESIAAEALTLAAAPNCPTGVMDIIIDPDQMILQIHESIGHPIELDRILGDERNYAGTTFVTKEMIGSYQYGSPLLNVTFDPGVSNEVASYSFDDEGARASKELIIKDGVLVRGLGSTISQSRLDVPGVASSRACQWNRPPIDRMANLNVEPGESTIEEMIGAVKKGIYVKSNNSWSIDDSRNKFQFGCEWGQLIEDGELTEVVKSPNYRGVSATFWRSLDMVGTKETQDVFGTPYCGKGEPNQAIRVGHASPACLFRNVEVFGGV